MSPFNVRIQRLEKALRSHRRGTIHDAIAGALMYNFEIDLFPERQRPVAKSDDDVWDDIPANVWDNYWVDERKVKECRAAWGRYLQSGRDPTVLEQLRQEFAGFRTADHCGFRPRK